MKTINVVFEDSEFESLKEKKGSISWHDFILNLLDRKEINQNEGD